MHAVAPDILLYGHEFEGLMIWATFFILWTQIFSLKILVFFPLHVWQVKKTRKMKFYFDHLMEFLILQQREK